MRIGIEVIGFPGMGRPEGQARYALHLVRGLLQLRSDHEYVLFYNSYRKRVTKRQIEESVGSDRFGLVHSRVPLTDRFELASTLKYRLWSRYARSRGIDVFHGTSYAGLGGSRPRSVITVHDFSTYLFPFTARPGRWRARLVREIAAATHVIAPSEHTRRDLVTFLGVDEEKVSTVHEGCVVETQGRQSSSTPLEPPLPHDYLLHVGSFRINKNVERLVRAFSLLSRSRPGLALVLAGGEGGDRSRLEALASGLSIRDRVRFLGFVSDAQLESLYSGALALVLPSLYEGFGLTALEAMVRGCPVVASRHSSIPEVVGDAALLFDPLDVQDMADKLTRIVADDSLRMEMVESGRRRAAAFTWEEAARQTLEVYEKCAR